MVRPSIDVRVPVPATDGSGTWEIAATVHLPPADVHEAPVLVGLPGAGYARGYFDLPEPGFSEAEHHTARGTVVIAVDHLGVGESSIPPLEVTDLATVAAAGHAAVCEILARLVAGTLAPGCAPITPTAVVGAGQSMGGFVLVTMQAHHRTFDAVAVLGASMVATTMPLRPDAAPVEIPEGTDPATAAQLAMAAIDWRYAFHVEDGSPALVEADVAGGLPVRQTAPAWGSCPIPGLAGALTAPGVIAAEAGAVDVPVLVAAAERDVTVALIDELRAFSSATDLAGFVLPRAAHMHNFAPSRTLLWARIDAFLAQVAGMP